jgi:hypothetical protein
LKAIEARMMQIIQAQQQLAAQQQVKKWFIKDLFISCFLIQTLMLKIKPFRIKINVSSFHEKYIFFFY